MRKALRIVALCVTGLLLLAAVLSGSALWYVSRSTPVIDGTLELAGLEAPVKVYRDHWGVPHIYAQNDHDLFMAQGYITAQDRLFQMDISRRLASGRLSEVMGSEQIDSDRFFRTLGLRRVAEASLEKYPPATVALGNAYTAGVNAFIDQAVRYHLLPWEFGALRYKPEPWSFVDSITIYKYWAYEASGHWDSQLFRYQLLNKVGQKRAVEIFPGYPQSAPTIMNYTPPVGASLDDSDLQRLLAFAPLPYLGSNAWAVGGGKTDTGKPFLANDPHVSVQTPAVWYESHLVSPGAFNVIGVSFPGIPGVMLGHNASIAWGAANMSADVQDVYVERANASDPHKFLYKEQWEAAKVEHETIKVRGEDPDSLDVLITRHGPLISALAPVHNRAPELAFSLRWPGLEPSVDLAGVLALDRATNWDEFRQAISLIDSPAQNIVYSDVVGNIGYSASGKIPIRKAANALLPLPAWTGQDEWQGYIPFKELPQSYNPKAGYVVAANNKVISDEYPYHLSDQWAAPWRAIRLRDQFLDARALSLQSMQALQTDVTDLDAKRYAAVLLDACRQATGGKWSDLEADARTALGEWDYAAKAESPGALVWNQWRVQLMQVIFEPAMGAPLFQEFLNSGSADAALDNLLETYLQGGSSQWFEPGKDSIRSLPRLAEDSFRRTADLLASRQSKDIDKWQWGTTHQLFFSHPLSRQPLLQRLLVRGPYGLGGDPVSVDATGYRLTQPFLVNTAAVWRQVVDLSDLTRSLEILGPGESGHILSPYYLNAATAWLNGTYHPQVFGQANMKQAHLLNLLPHWP